MSKSVVDGIRIVPKAWTGETEWSEAEQEEVKVYKIVDLAKADYVELETHYRTIEDDGDSYPEGCTSVDLDSTDVVVIERAAKKLAKKHGVEWHWND